MQHHIAFYLDWVLDLDFIFGYDYFIDLLLDLDFRVFLGTNILQLTHQHHLLLLSLEGLTDVIPHGLTSIPDRFEDELGCLERCELGQHFFILCVLRIIIQTNELSIVIRWITDLEDGVGKLRIRQHWTYTQGLWFEIEVDGYSLPLHVEYEWLSVLLDIQDELLDVLTFD